MNRAEEAFQIQVVDWLALNGLRGVHVPNQGKRSPLAGYKLKKAGLWTGFTDLLVFGRPERWCGRASQPNERGFLCVAELKAPGRAKALDDAQELVRAELLERGVPVFKWQSLEHAARDLRGLGVWLRVGAS